jgi:dipeptide/tripeptide permease
MPDATPHAPAPVRSPLGRLIQPFTGLHQAPRALWAVYLSTLLEGFVYFGMLIYLAMYFNEYAGLTDLHAGWMVGALTSGITLSMLFFGGSADRWGLRRAILLSLSLMFLGRLLLALAPRLGLAAGALLSPFVALAMAGILLVVLGYGIYVPAGYAAVRQFTTPATANMGFAMLYAVMNLGAWLPTFMSPIRQRYQIRGAFLFYAASTAAGLVISAALLSRRSVAAARTATEAHRAPAAEPLASPAGLLAAVGHWLRQHPLADLKFACFIFCLVPVQTLFAYNWLVLPQYVNRAFAGTWVGARFEAATSLNAILIFILCPMVAAVTARAKVYPMMILGTGLMAAPTFILALGPTVPGLFGFIVLMTVGEAIWQPRFLQYAAEIAPEGRTGAYMGVAQFPWFLTKMFVPIYSGAALARWCPDPAKGPLNTAPMWMLFGSVAMLTSILLILAKGWLGKGFKVTARQQLPGQFFQVDVAAGEDHPHPQPAQVELAFPQHAHRHRRAGLDDQLGPLPYELHGGDDARFAHRHDPLHPLPDDGEGQ